MNSQLVDNPIILGINATLLIGSGLAAVIVSISFHRSTFSKAMPRAFFFTVSASVLALFSYSASLLHHPEVHDTLYFTCSAIAYIGVYATQYMYIRYVVICINSQRNNPIPNTELYATLFFCMVSSLLWILSTGDGKFMIPESPTENYGLWFWVGHLGEWSLLASSALLLFWYNRLMIDKRMLSLLSVPLLLTIATLIEPLTPGLALRYPALMSGLLIVYTRFHLRFTNAYEDIEDTYAQSRFTLAYNRMKPHFINNIISSIYYLCDLDAKKAQDLSMTFSGYMMGALETVDRAGLIPFSRELETIRNYIALEMLRFEDKLNVEYDIEVEDFNIPPLTVQALVENSVKHGIAGKGSPGTVSIITRRLADGSVQIRVTDNGVGFNTADSRKPKNELAYIKDRLDREMGGRMSIRSAIDEGTTVTIKLRGEN